MLKVQSRRKVVLQGYRLLARRTASARTVLLRSDACLLRVMLMVRGALLFVTYFITGVVSCCALMSVAAGVELLACQRRPPWLVLPFFSDLEPSFCFVAYLSVSSV